ncbi:hypothetical protein D1AOALGA4SA_10635 [Olavius algarvensis Delta 1 endosymbiont]|nr:hypothetical protein D1AOALGA4SA_10635 [Olavius algarvensis Delta 1 endosymbiont]
MVSGVGTAANHGATGRIEIKTNDHRTCNIELSTSNIECRMPKTERRTPNTEYRPLNPEP